MSKYATVDHQHFPIVTVTFYKEVPTEDEFIEYLNDLIDLYLCGENLVVIFDASKIKSFSIDFLQRYNHWLETKCRYIKKHILMNIYVFPNVMQRTKLTSLYLLRRPTISYQLVKSIEEAESLAKKVMGLSGKQHLPIIPIE